MIQRGKENVTLGHESHIKIIQFVQIVAGGVLMTGTGVVTEVVAAADSSCFAPGVEECGDAPAERITGEYKVSRLIAGSSVNRAMLSPGAGAGMDGMLPASPEAGPRTMLAKRSL
jgi:hypothetical protein